MRASLLRSHNIPAKWSGRSGIQRISVNQESKGSTTTDTNVGDDYVWSVFEMVLAADGSYTISPVNIYFINRLFR